MPRAAVIGCPITHSLSPALHRAGYDALGLTDWSYGLIECDEFGLPALLGSLGPEWAGLSVTMPCKRAVLDVVDTRTDLVDCVGAANTILLSDSGRRAENTDVGGMVDALRAAGVVQPHSALVLGAGGTAQAAVAAIADLGLQEVVVAARDPARAEALLRTAAAVGVTAAVLPWASARHAGWVDLIVSTVPAGAANDLAGELDLRASTTVFDVVYAPWPTVLAERATAAGARIVAGSDLLLHQAVRQFALMTGRTPPVDAMRAGFGPR